MLTTFRQEPVVFRVFVGPEGSQRASAPQPRASANAAASPHGPTTAKAPCPGARQLAATQRTSSAVTVANASRA